MDDKYVSGATVLAGVLWTLAGLCLVGSWAAWGLYEASMVSHLLIGTGLMLSLGAVVAHMKRMTCRVLTLIRSSGRRAAESQAAELRSVR